MLKNKYIAIIGVLLAVTITLSVIENAIALPLPLGIKLGLASIPIMFAIMNTGPKSALILTIAKSIFVLATRSVIAFIMSISGGLLSLAVMLLLYYKFKPSILQISVAGGVSHNLGQLVSASLIMQNPLTLYYAPLLIIAGCIAGILTGICLNSIIPVLRKIYSGGIK